MSKQSDGDFVLQNKAKDLYLYTSEAISNAKIIPKSRRYPVGQRLESLALDIFLSVAEANNKDVRTQLAERKQIQDHIIAACDSFKALINSLKASSAYPGIDSHKAEVWTRYILDVYYMTRAWRSSEQGEKK